MSLNQFSIRVTNPDGHQQTIYSGLSENEALRRARGIRSDQAEEVLAAYQAGNTEEAERRADQAFTRIEVMKTIRVATHVIKYIIA